MYETFGPEGIDKVNQTLKEYGIPIPEHPTWEDLDKILQLVPRSLGGLFTTIPTYLCGRCLVYCPAGRDELLKEFLGNINERL